MRIMSSKANVAEKGKAVLTTSMSTEEINRKQKEYIWPSVTNYYPTPVPMARGEMQKVWDTDGNEYLDFFGGIVTVSVGHCNETVNCKTAEQMERLQHVSTVFATEPQAALAKRIAEISPGGK